jgi:hypothetical protein
MSAATATARLFSMHRSAACARRPTRTEAVGGAVAATLAVWLFAHLAGVELTVRSGAGDATSVGPASVAVASLLAGLAASGLMVVLERISSRPRVVFTRIALLVLVLSLGGPIGLGVTAATTATLVCIHLTAAGVLIPGMARSTVSRS